MHCISLQRGTYDSNDRKYSRVRVVNFAFYPVDNVVRIDLFNYQIVAIPAHIENLSLNSQEYCHLCSTLAKVCCE